MSNNIEEAKRICKEIIKTNMFNRNTDAEAIETVLQALDNSISKDKVKEKIEKIDENGYWDFLEERDIEKTKEILQELLEDK